MKILHILTLLFLISCCSFVQAQTYEVGVMNFSFTDAARNNRVVDGEIHYPATTAGNNVAIATGQFPLIVFGHGFSVDIDQYDGVYSEGLVREGYIIVYPTTEDGLSPNHADFADDLSFLIDTYLAENMLASSFFFQSMNGETALMGHSMGGGASFAAAAQNANITAHASLAAAETNAPASAIAAAANITIPSLVIAAEGECVTPNIDHQIPMYNALTSSYKAYLAIIDGSPCDFGEAAFFSNCVLAEGALFCGPYIDLADQHTYTLAALKPWFDYWLKGDCMAWDTYQTYLTTASTHNYLQERTQPVVSNITDNSATITFPTLPNASLYTLTLMEQGTMTTITASAATNSITMTGLSPLTTYDFEITTDCGTGNSPYTIDCTDANTTCSEFNFTTVMSACVDILNLNTGIVSDTYNANVQIVCDGLIAMPENVIFEAGNNIELNPDFEVQLGAEFLGRIDVVDPCN